MEINIAELLKDCPKGMELYSTIFGVVYFEGVKDTGNAVLIDVKTMCNSEYQFYPDGKFNTYYSDSEMTLFPSKDVRTWEGIEAPFKDGDIVSTDDGMFTAIVRRVVKCEVKDLYNHDEGYSTYCHIYYEEDDDKAYFVADDTLLKFYRLANEEEKERLFFAVNGNGYKWNAETKTLEMLIEPKFKVGDKIRQKNHHEVCLISEICDDHYLLDEKDIALPFFAQDQWELVPNKFDVNALKPFDKVLVRGDVGQRWTIDFFGFMDNNKGCPFVCVGHYVIQCIPYEGNEHLLGTDEDCDEYYKTWK